MTSKAMMRRVLQTLKNKGAHGHEITPNHPVTHELAARGYITLSDAVLSPTGEKLKNGWAKITKDGRKALTGLDRP